jgi:hypothetical protein
LAADCAVQLFSVMLVTFWSGNRDFFRPLQYCGDIHTHSLRLSMFSTYDPREKWLHRSDILSMWIIAAAIVLAGAAL